MGTRAVYGFKKNNKYKITFSLWDGSYEDLGKAIVDFITTTTLKQMNDIFDKIILVDPMDIATTEQIEECKKYANLNICSKTLEDFTCLLANTIGNLQLYRDDNLRYMINHESYLNQEKFQYIINLDNKQLEIYWYEMLVNSYSLSNISKNWIEECDRNVDKCYDIWKKQNPEG